MVHTNITAQQIDTLFICFNILGWGTDEGEYIDHFTQGRKCTLDELTNIEANCLIILLREQVRQKKVGSNLQLLNREPKNSKAHDNKSAKIATINLLKELNLTVK